MNQDPNCPFCQIVSGKLGSIFWQNQEFASFYDIKPKAKIHVLIVPKEHIADLDGIESKDLAAGLIFAAKEVAAQLYVDSGFRLVLNNKQAGGQVVGHLHLHLLAGEHLTEF